MTASLLGWGIDVRFRVMRGLGLGVSAQLLSWRRAYPWIVSSLMLGPFALSVDFFVRPDAIAREMRRRRAS